MVGMQQADIIVMKNNSHFAT